MFFSKDIYIDKDKADIANTKPLVTLDQVYAAYKARRPESAFVSPSSSFIFSRFVDYMKTIYTIY
jgi:hypothetical protein